MTAAVTSWEPPRWCGTATLADEGRVEYYCPVGTVFPTAEGEPAFTVAVGQVDTISPATDVVGVERGAAQVMVLGLRLTPAEAHELARLLGEAAELVHDTRAGGAL